MSIIEAHDLRKTYRSRTGDVHALDGLDLTVPEGTVKGLLGPNGAGKTTTVKVLNTLLQPDSGTASVAGIDVLRDPDAVRRVIGASGQYAAVDEHLTGRENLEMVGRLYHLGRTRSSQRAGELLEQFDLVEAGDRPVKGFSGGMRRRIDLACAIVNRPPVLFLDEPTTGLDPRSRIGLWQIIKDLVTDGTTVLLTTQYLEEADALADHISVVDHGKVISEGTSDELKAQLGGHRVVVTLVEAADAESAREILARHGAGDVHIDAAGRTLDVPVSAGTDGLQGVLADLASAEIALHDAGMRRPTLDDVFLSLTGREAGDGADDPSSTAGAELNQ
ncbi:MAG: ATP-binding cassette domain-containing protein [Actinomycetia bacterium]|nr:ATP-binding cassette domain-containing protein [Actinomycetes bacterium]